VKFVRQAHGLSERRACSALEMSRSVNRYMPRPRDDRAVIDAVLEQSNRYPDFGFGKLFKVLCRQGHRWNHKRLYRVYCGLKLNKRRRGKKRLPSRYPLPLAVSATMNGCWSADFTSDAFMVRSPVSDLQCGR